MRPTKFFAALVLTLLTVIALQAQNHNNNDNHNGNNNGQGNNQSNYYNGNHPSDYDNANDGHHGQNHQPQRAFKGYLVSCRDDEHSSHASSNGWNGGNDHSAYNQHSGGQNWSNDYGIVLQSRGNDGDFHRFDERGNRLVRELLRNQRPHNRRAFVQVRGRVGRDGTILVSSVKMIGKPINDSSFASLSFGNHNNHPNWSFQLFVGLP
jgi:hypothetical protein